MYIGPVGSEWGGRCRKHVCKSFFSVCTLEVNEIIYLVLGTIEKLAGGQA